MIQFMVVIRCDSSHEIGIGHVKRCLSLAERLRQLKYTVHFCCKNRPGHSIHLIEKAGFPVTRLENDESTGSELEKIRHLSPDWVVIDHYQIQIDYESQIRAFSKVFVVDDLMSRKHDCDVLLDQNYRQTSTGYGQLVPKGCRILMGPRYSLLPLEIEDQKKSFQRQFDKKDRHVLAFFGGGDPTGEFQRFYASLQKSQLSCQYHLVAMSSHAHFEKLKTLSSTANIHLHLDPKNWLELLQKNDFYFGSVGTVTWERFYFGLPGAVVTVADNQVAVAAELHKNNLVYNFGNCLDIDYLKAIPIIQDFAMNLQYCEEMSNRITTVVEPINSDLLNQIFSAS